MHGTSLNNTNTLVSGDNKGAAAQFMERWARQAGGAGWQAGRAQAASSSSSSSGGGSGGEQAAHEDSGGDGGGGGVSPGLVAAFCQANVGDTSPNTQGAFCMDTGLPCDAVHSTCNGRVQQCIGRGPGWPDHFESARLVGQRQADAAQELLLGGERARRESWWAGHAFGVNNAAFIGGRAMGWGKGGRTLHRLPYKGFAGCSQLSRPTVAP